MNNSKKIANYVISLCLENDFSISNLKLQKLLYYIQWWWLGIFKEKIIDCEFEARTNGPVCRSIYTQYNGSWYSNLSPTDQVIAPNNPDYDSLINEIVVKYWKLEAWDLVSLTHKEDPWINARKWIKDWDPSNVVIADKSMQEYFSAKYESI